MLLLLIFLNVNQDVKTQGGGGRVLIEFGYLKKNLRDTYCDH